MPQIDLRYSGDLTINTHVLFTQLETTINNIDDSAGVCKCRAYPANEYLHTHVYLSILLLKKQHRDIAFMENCVEKVNDVLQSYLPENCYFATMVDFVSPYYLTSKQ